MFCRILPVLALLAAHGWAAEPVRYRPDRVILMPKRGAAPERLAQLHQSTGRRILKSYNWLGGLQVVQLSPGENVGEAIFRYRASGEVEFAEPDYKLRAFVSPNDPEFRRGTQWALYNSGQFGGKLGADISASAGWETLTSASHVVVAVIDSGIRYTHEDLAANMWTNPGEVPGNGIDDDRNGYIDDVHGIDAIVNTGDPMDDAGHGTHVAGIIGAAGNNGLGIAGVAWRVKLMGLRFLSKVGDGDTSDAIQCIDYARRMGAHVINASWGGTDYSVALYSAINTARSAGLMFVTAAGNDMMDLDQVPLYPACYNLDNIVVVGGTTRGDLLDSSYSSYGANSVDLFAPGTGIYSTWHTWDGSYTSSTGTSMATPHVAGVLALMKARFTNYSNHEIISRLLATVDALPGLAGKCRTGGRLNMARALGPNPAAGFTVSTLSGEPPLTVTFTNTSFGEVLNQRWTFGDGSAVVTESQPTHVFEYAGTFRVNLEITGTNGVTNSFQQEIKVAPNYQSASAEYAWIDPSGMPALSLTDNGVSPELMLPFPFKFYGETFESLYIAANGVLSFSAENLGVSDNTTLPVATAPNALICPYWDNLNPAGGGTVHAGVAGEAPNRKFVVSWVKVPRNSSGVTLTFQVVLEEATHEIVFQYLEVQSNTSRGGAKRATVGLENASGTISSLYTYNGSPVVIQNETAVRFSQRPFRFLSVEGPASARFTGVLGHGFPDETLTLQLRNLGNQEIRWEARSSAPWLGVLQSSGTLAPDESTAVEVILTEQAATVPSGTLLANLELVNLDDGRGGRTIPVTLEIMEPAVQLEAELVTTNSFSGGLGGPFLPETISAVLRNTGSLPIFWIASSSAGWLQPDLSGAELAPGESTTVDFRLNLLAGELGSGSHAATMRFQVDGGDGSGIEFPVQLQVNAVLLPRSATIADGVFTGSFDIPIEGTYFIEASEDLLNWVVLDIEPRISGRTVSFDEAVDSSGVRFFRLLVTP